MTKEEIKQKTSLCFLLNPNISEEEKICVIEKVMATKATIVSKAALSNIITYILKQNAELDCQMNRNKYCYSCVNETDRCFRNEISCPCEKYKSYKDLNKQLTKAKEIIEKFSEFVNNDVEFDQEHPQEHTDLWNELCEKAAEFLNSEVEK